MSVEYCENCNQMIDTDVDAEHFDTDQCVSEESYFDEKRGEIVLSPSCKETFAECEEYVKKPKFQR